MIPFTQQSQNDKIRDKEQSGGGCQGSGMVPSKEWI